MARGVYGLSEAEDGFFGNRSLFDYETKMLIYFLRTAKLIRQDME